MSHIRFPGRARTYVIGLSILIGFVAFITAPTPDPTVPVHPPTAAVPTQTATAPLNETKPDLAIFSAATASQAPPATVPAPVVTKPAADAPKGMTYVFVPGDTLSKRFGRNWKLVHRANPGLRPERIAIGTVITVPDGISVLGRDTPPAGPSSKDASHRRQPSEPTARKSQPHCGQDHLSKADTVVCNARKLADAHVMYRWGGNDPWKEGVDCSGLVHYAYSTVGIRIKQRESRKMAQTTGRKVSTKGLKLDDLRLGDLVFYYSPVSHVAIYAGDGKVVNASHSGHPVAVGDVHLKSVTAVRRLL